MPKKPYLDNTKIIMPLNKTILKYFLFHVSLSTTYFLCMYLVYRNPFTVVFYHFSVVIFIHCLFFAILMFGRNSQTIKQLVITLASFYWLYLITLYILNSVSFFYWGAPVLNEFIVNLPNQILSVTKALNISLLFIPLIIILPVFFIWLLAYYLVLKSGFFDECQRMLSTSPAKSYIYIAIYVGSSIFIFNLSYNRGNPDQWIYEPITASFTQSPGYFTTPKSTYEVFIDKKERARQNYQPLTKKSPNIILIMVDSLRSDHFSFNGYHRPTTPYLSTLVKSNTLEQIDFFTSACSESVCGIYSTLSSRGYQNFGFKLLDLTEVLKRSGYTNSFILSDDHNYYSLNKLYGSFIDNYIDGKDFKDGLTLKDDEGVTKALKNIDFDASKPQFIYLHLMSAHSLGENKEQHQKYLPQAPLRRRLVNAIGENVLEKFTNGYDNGLIQLDYYIEQIFSILKEKELFNDSIIILTGDHGDALGEHGSFSHTVTLYQEEVSIPFFWRSENCPLKNYQFGTHVDIAPTILDCLNIPTPKTWQGQSLLEPMGEERITYHQTIRNNRFLAAILYSNQRKYKLMANENNSNLTNYLMFDLIADPDERNNIIETANPELVKKMTDALKAHFDLQ